MLALTRRVSEEIVIGDPKNPLGTIRVVSIHGDKVRLSFDFPTDTQINRKELADEKARQGTPGHPPGPHHPPSPGNQAPPPPPPQTAAAEPNGNIKPKPPVK